jgi:hypothetical protein
VTVALPFLDAMGPAGLAAPARAQAPGPPRRVLFVFTGAGSVLKSWRPAAVGPDPPPSRILAPLATPELKPYLTALSGINQQAGGGYFGPHPAGMATCLTATEPNKANKLATGPSIDIVLGRRLKGQTPFETLHFGVQTNIKAMGHSQWLSYREAAGGGFEGVFAEDSPANMFRKLFMNQADAAQDAAGANAALERLLAQDRSVLDFAIEDYRRLAARLGGVDRARLDEHATLLRGLEKRLVVRACRRPVMTSFTDSRNFPAVTDMQIDLIAAAFACDLVRVGTLQWNTAEPPLSLTALDPSFRVVAPRAVTGVSAGSSTTWHHGVSHLPSSWDPATAGEGDRAVLEVLTKVQIWFSTRLAELARKLKSTVDADGRSVLDNTLVFWTSENAEGTHSLQDMPFTVIGNLGGALRSNVHLAYNRTRQHGDVFATIGTALGLPGFDRFGREGFSKGVLTEWLR